jgi:signal transduction histidine kinase
MLPRHDRSPPWIASLPAGLLLGSVVLRASLSLQDHPALPTVLILLGVWLAVFLGEPAIQRRWPRAFYVYMAVQSGLAFFLMAGLNIPFPDYFALLFAGLSMQVLRRVSAGAGAAWLGLFTILVAGPLLRTYDLAEAIGATLLLSAVNVFFGLYARATSRAWETWSQNEEIVQRLDDSNRKLQAATAQLEQLAVVRARQRLARDLHDSVTQTAFSMNLAAQSASLMLERNPDGVGPQLDHLGRLAQVALTQMQMLISELRPEKVAEGGLASALRRHLAERPIPDGLTVSVQEEGRSALRASEELGLFSIAREAINNIVRHAKASEAHVGLYYTAPARMDVTDNGRGFDGASLSAAGGVGVTGMREQAAEIGWDLELTSTPGRGTRLRVVKSTRE